MADEYWRLPYTAAQLQGAATNQVPRVGSNGNWEVWDIDTSAWVDTGVVAQGDGVTSFNGRQGAILPESADYSEFFAPAGYGLGAPPTRLTSADDLDDLKIIGGWYSFQYGNLPANAPPSDGSTYNWVVRVDSLFQTAYGVRNAPATDYCPILRRVYYNTWGPWEYINPPLIAGQEYRTTERWNGKPVYMQAYSVTSGLPAKGNAKSVALGITNLDTIISVSASLEVTFSNNQTAVASAPYRDMVSVGAYYTSTSQYLDIMHFSASTLTSINSVFAVVKYTKTSN